MRGIGPDWHAVLALRMPRDPVADFPRQVQPLAVVLQLVDDAEALFVVLEAARHERLEHAFAGVAERRVPEIVAERDGFRELLVQAEHLRDAARNLRHFERVRQARAVVVACRREEDLRLVFQPPEGLAVDDAVAIALKRRPDGIFALGMEPSTRVRALCGLRCEELPFARLEIFTDLHPSSKL